MAITDHKTILDRTVLFVQATLQNAEAGHDWHHINRVWKMSKNILETESKANSFITQLAALLHDIADPKFHEGDELKGPKIAEGFLRHERIDDSEREHICQIIRHMSFKNSLEGKIFDSLEMQIVQDADRLDALGAIGIARTFHYGGFKNQLIFDPLIPARLQLDKKTYTEGKSSSINHFYEKLLNLSSMMNTDYAKQVAQNRHDFMVAYLAKFYDEWDNE